MKVAKDVKGQEVIAEEGAPRRAVCPYCGGTVILRGRRTMANSEKSYYWRHLDNEHPDCPGRTRNAH